MRKFFTLLTALLLAAMTAGCQDDTLVTEKGDFTFHLPEGYSIANVSDKACSIVRDEDDAIVGGFNLTNLTVKDLRKDRFGYYLDHVFGKQLPSDFFSMENGSRKNPIRYISHSVTDPDTQTRRDFKRTLFTKDHAVYDMWFDLQRIDVDAASAFSSIVEPG